MKAVVAFLVGLFFSLFAQAITIGFIPGDHPDQLKVNASKFAEYLQAEIKQPVDIYISSNYAGLIEAMKSKKVDFAFFSALTFVDAEKDAGAKVLLKKVFATPFYYSAIGVKKKTKIKSIKDLKGKKIAFVDQKSASGFLYPQVMLNKMGFDAKTFFSEVIFSGNHEASVKLLKDGKVDAVAVFSDDDKGKKSAFAKYLGDKEAGDVRLIWFSEPIPNDPFCVRQDFYDKNPKLTHEVMFALLEIKDKFKDDSQVLEFLGLKEMMYATSRQYDPVREMAQHLRKGAP